ncbi:MAG TPA: endonuclease [Gemmatimonadaceae bacterium]|nr:endonuclease [Gemmatimonadaceae bacterium]
MRRALFLALILLAAACEDDFTSPIDSRFPLTGTFRDTLIADAADTVTFTPGRTGTTTVAICGEPGFNFDLEGEGETSTTPSNCERITFDAIAGESYTVVVRAVEGDGVYGGCWSTALVQCAPFEPVACAPPAASGDTALPAGYYGNAEGKTGAALLAALDRILCRTRALSYDNIRDSMYANIEDPDNNDLLADIYTGRVATVNSRATALTADFNTEHSWPQSKGAQDFPAMTDVHHLFPADEVANSQRSNLPFGVVVGTPTWMSPDPDGDGDVSKRGLDANNREVFEPRNAKKGDIARAILYFYARYNLRRTASFTLENFNIEEPVLLQWVAADPPDAFERQRNSLAFRVQGNRNPFVDRPELVAAVGDWPNN